jgi:hypothetical protein
MRRAAALVALAALAAGCGSEDSGDAPAAAPSAGVASTGAPDGSASPGAVTAANTAEVCQAVDKLIVAGSKKIADESAAATRGEETSEELNSRLKATLGGLADDVRKQAGRAEDPGIEELLTDTAKQLDAGARSSTPVKWLGSTFVDIPPKLTRECRA